MNAESETQAPSATDTTALTQQLTVVSTALIEIDRVGAGVAELRKKYAGLVFDVSTTKGLEEARAARMAVREPRYALEKIRKKAKRPILDLGNKLDSEAERINTELLALETPIDAQIKAEEKRKEDEREAKAVAERRRVGALQTRIDEIREHAADLFGLSSAAIAERFKALDALTVDDTFQELKQQAEGAKATTLIRLTNAHRATLAAEQEAARLAAERAELARQKAEQEAERARLAEEDRQRRVAQAAEDARRAEQQRLQREEQARQDRERQEVLAAEQARIDAARAQQEAEAQAERDRLAAERAQQERVAQAERDRLAAERAEADRLETERQAAAAAEEKRLADERARLEQEQAELRAAWEKAAAPPAPEPVPAPSPVATLQTVEEPPKPWRPSDESIIEALCEAYTVPPLLVISWLRDMDLQQLAQRAA